LPKSRCCSTEAGSVSAWVTMMRPARCGALRVRRPRRARRSCRRTRSSARRSWAQGRCPAVTRACARSRSGPAVGLHAHRGAQVDLVRLESLGPTSRHQERKLGCHCSSARCRPPVAREIDVVRDGLQRLCHLGPPPVEARALRLAVQAERAGLAGRVGRMKIQFCHAERRPKILVAASRGRGSGSWLPSR